jgi:hypothetical protein
MPDIKDNEVYDPKKQGDPQLRAAENALLALIAGKNPQYLQSRNLVRSTPAIGTDDDEKAAQQQHQHAQP